MIRIATVGYLNARPLTSRIDRERFEVIEGHPSEIADLLARGDVDVALVPVAAALTDGDFRVVPDVCIGALGPVETVLLAAELPPERWTEVVLDGVSRTSVTLARLLLAGPLSERIPADVQIVDCPPGDGLQRARGTVASLIIGDAAMRLPPRLTHRIDLAEQWTAWTGLPFVFAVWAGRPDLPSDVQQHLRDAGLEGLAARQQDYQGAELEYVTRALRYDLDERALVGLRRYAALAHAAGLVGTDVVQFFGPAQAIRPRADLGNLLERAAAGQTLSDDAISALAAAPLADLMVAADLRREALRPGPVLWSPCLEVVLTDIDAYEETSGFLRTPGEVADLAEAAADVKAGQLLLKGSRHPGVASTTWIDAVHQVVRSCRSDVWGLDLALLAHLEEVGPDSLTDLLAALSEAGLSGVAEGATLVLDDSVRAGIPGVIAAEAWHRMAAAVSDAGLRWRGGLQIGAGEDLVARIQHLLALRRYAVQGSLVSVQIETVDPRLHRHLADGSTAATAHDLLRAVALARLVLPASCAVEAVWIDAAPSLAQAALEGGADVLAPVVLPSRGIAADLTYVNPRAAAAQRRVNDPWQAFVVRVEQHLAPLARTSRRVTSTAAPTTAADTSRQPSL